ncbi:helicase DnaB [Cyanobium sp. NIES-981]|uniref:helicase DnaB n=1 Tax=Cyanobium sp. NIES-981 TaxID=1851505 RepID=UPI000B359B24
MRQALRLGPDRVRPASALPRHGRARRRRFRAIGVLAGLGLAAFTPAGRWQESPSLVLEPGLSSSVHYPADGSNPDPLQFSASELQELQRRFGVHGPQPQLAQLFTEGIDQFEPLRNHTLARLEDLRPVILSASAQHRINPMLVTAVLFDEMRHAKPGEDLPIAAHSGLFSTHGPAQLGLGEMVHQGLLRPDATAEEVMEARRQLLDPQQNVVLLVGKFARLSDALGFPRGRVLQASADPREAKALATLAYLHNGKLDYPRRILRSMQDPALHALLYGTRRPALSPLI